MRRRNFTPLLLTLLLLAGRRGFAQDKTDLFETKVRPLLLKQCSACHGNAQQLGGLRLDTREGFLKGGAHGSVVVPNQPDKSPLIQAVRYAGNLKMPPAGRLSNEQVSTLEQWVKGGGEFPQSTGKSAPSAVLWALQPVRKTTPPRVALPAWNRNPIDAFILKTMTNKGMRPAPPADRRSLLRRLTFDLIGAPPSPEEIASFIADKSPNAYEKRVDALLASKHYGERWARYWLDVARYADSSGYERDASKPYSWKYRDYVIQALNEDMPYNRFVTEQLAGDELPDRSEKTVTATGFLRLGTWDDEPNDALQYRYERLDDVVHTTSVALIGLTVRCARCHDHKYDPILQKDYYAFASMFYGGYFDPGDGKLMGGPPEEKLGYPVLGFTDSGRNARPLHLLISGDPRNESAIVPPGFPSFLPSLQREVIPAPEGSPTTRRRLQLADWITDPHNPLTARVFVNRIWKYHFGQGLVRTPNNFGIKGSPPTHPELLDYLASDFVQGGWKIKRLHRLMVMSEAYKMSSLHPDEARFRQKDSLNLTLWKFPRQRLDSDALRDSLLTVSGAMNPKMGGEGFVPSVTREALEGLSRKGAEWNPSNLEEQSRRSIYMYLKRALIMPFMTVFDFGDTTQSLEQRDVTTVPLQALALLNNPFMQGQSEAFARRVEREAGTDPQKQVERAWRLAVGRSPSPAEAKSAVSYLIKHTLAAPIVDKGWSDTAVRSGLRLWLRADRGVVRDERGRAAVWEDQSSNLSNAAQSNNRARPTFIEKAENGLPTVRFSGAGEFFSIANQVIPSQQFTVVAVANDRANGGGHREIFSNWNRETNIASSIFLGATGSANLRFTDFFLPVSPLYQPGKPFLLTAVADRDSATLFKGRFEAARQASALPLRNLTAPYVIGQQGNINGEFWNGDIYEILVYDHALSEKERNTVWNMLDERYKLAPSPLPAPIGLTSLCHVLFNTNEFLYVD